MIQMAKGPLEVDKRKVWVLPFRSPFLALEIWTNYQDQPAPRDYLHGHVGRGNVTQFFSVVFASSPCCYSETPSSATLSCLVACPLFSYGNFFFFGGRTRDVVTTTVLPAWVE